MVFRALCTTDFSLYESASLLKSTKALIFENKKPTEREYQVRRTIDVSDWFRIWPRGFNESNWRGAPE
jgi:hypothetical protein